MNTKIISGVLCLAVHRVCAARREPLFSTTDLKQTVGISGAHRSDNRAGFRYYLQDLLEIFMIGMEFLITSFIVYALLAGKACTWIVNSPGTVKYVQRTFAAMFDMLGARLAVSGR